MAYLSNQLPNAIQWAVAPAKLFCKKYTRSNPDPLDDKELFFSTQELKKRSVCLLQDEVK